MLPGTNLWGIIWGAGFGSIVMLAMGAAMLWFIYILPIRGRYLAVRGVPVIGKLTDKSQYQDSEAQTYYFHYQYTPSDSPSAPITGKQRVRDTDWDQPQIGDSYTVLYDPRNPQNSVLYLYGDFEAIK